MATRQTVKATKSQSVPSTEGEREDEVDETQPEEGRDEDEQSSGDEMDTRAMVEELLRSVVTKLRLNASLLFCIIGHIGTDRTNRSRI